MKGKKRFLILGAFIFLLGIHYLVLVLAGYDWIGSLFALSEICGYLFLFMMGCGCVLRSIFLRVDRRILEVDQEETRLKNGSRIAVYGTIEPDRAQVSSPFLGRPCVLYEYHIFRKEEDKEYPEAVGWAFAPSSVRADNGDFKLLDYPNLMGFPEEKVKPSIGNSAIQRIILQTRFKQLNWLLALLLPSVVAMIPSLSWLLFLSRRRDTGEIRTDIDYSGKKGAICADKVEERIVSPGTRVIAFGTYYSRHNALVSGWIGLRLVRANSGLNKLRKSLQEEILAYTIAGFVLIGLWLMDFYFTDMWFLYLDALE